MPCSFSVTAVATTMHSAITFEKVMPTTVSCLMRDRCSAHVFGVLAQLPRVRPAVAVLDFLRGLPEEQVRADRRAEHGDHHRRVVLRREARRQVASRAGAIRRWRAATAPRRRGSRRRRRTGRASATSGRARVRSYENADLACRCRARRSRARRAAAGRRRAASRASAIAPRSAAMLIVLATTSRPTSAERQPRGHILPMFAARPSPVTKPMRADSIWMPIISGIVRNSVQTSAKRNCAPACE